MIFSDLKAQAHMTFRMASFDSISNLVNEDRVCNKAAAKATEKAAELPRPAPTGISEVTVISRLGTSNPETLK
jgi:hypothetical protein